ncbi:MAG: hypothetical protein IJI49_05970 [Bacilli bacterium]|nr:hypothetical protein [Bacilli bacterium]
MKKSDIFLIVGVIVIIVVGGFIMKGSKATDNYDLPLALSGDAGLHELTYSEYLDKVNSNESFVFIVERATCAHCVNYMPEAESFATEYGVPMYYIDTDKFEESDWETFESTNTFFRKNSSWGTPTTIVLSGKYAVDYIVGETVADDLKELYNKYFDVDSYKNN